VAASALAVELSRRGGDLPQDDALAFIEARFGRGFVRENASGGQGINPAVLEAFAKLTPNTGRAGR
jgi:hypothetical protein